VSDALKYYYFSRLNRDGATAVQLGSRLPGNVTTFSPNTSDAEMTELNRVKPLAQFQHLDNNGIHFNTVLFPGVLSHQSTGYAFCGRGFKLIRHRLRRVGQTTQNNKK